MNKFLLLILSFPVLLHGCASAHFVEKKEDALLFSIRLPEANRVQFASSVDNFVLHDSIKTKSDRWLARVFPVQGLAYFYVVDGSFYIPDCPLRETDDFGAENCLFQPGL